jgi:hypothetical protein
MKRLTTDDLLREAAEAKVVRRSDLLPMLIEALRTDEASREQLALLMASVEKPERKRSDDMRGFAWLPTFAWERDGDSAVLKVTDVTKVPFRFTVFDEDGKAYDATFGSQGVYLVPEGALDPEANEPSEVG